MTWTAGTYERFIYDDNYNRAGSDGTRNITQDPFGNEAAVDDYFAINKANEYTSINRAGSGTSVSHDAAGNMTQFPVIPGAGTEAGNKVNALSTYDAFNQMQSAQAGSNRPWAYRYDALGRRLVEWISDGEGDFTGTRFIHEGYSVIMERKFTSYVVGEYPEQETMYPSTDDAHSKPHKIFVRGSILFSAVDGDLDGYIGAEGGTEMGTVNLPEFDEAETESGEEAVGDRIDYAYYYLDDARGRVMALLARDVETGVTHPYTEGGPEPEEANLPRILEYYRYSAYGSVTVLPVQDRAEASLPGVNSSGWYHAVDGYYPGSGSLGQWDRMEDTPLDLSDNFLLMYNRRVGDNNHVASGEHYGRESAWANEMVSSGRRWVAEVGVRFFGSAQDSPSVESDDPSDEVEEVWRWVGGDPTLIDPERDPEHWAASAKAHIIEWHQLFKKQTGLWTGGDAYIGKASFGVSWICHPRSGLAAYVMNKTSEFERHTNAHAKDAKIKGPTTHVEVLSPWSHTASFRFAASTSDKILDQIWEGVESGAVRLATLVGGNNAGNAVRALAKVLIPESTEWTASINHDYYIGCSVLGDGSGGIRAYIQIDEFPGNERTETGKYTWKGGYREIVDSGGARYTTWPAAETPGGRDNRGSQPQPGVREDSPSGAGRNRIGSPATGRIQDVTGG